MNPRWSLGAAILPWYADYSLSISVGGHVIRGILADKHLRGYFAAGTHYIGSSRRFERNLLGESFELRFHALALGAGPGLEVLAGPVGLVPELPTKLVFAPTPDTHLRFAGRTNFAIMPNSALFYHFGYFKRNKQRR